MALLFFPGLQAGPGFLVSIIVPMAIKAYFNILTQFPNIFFFPHNLLPLLEQLEQAAGLSSGGYKTSSSCERVASVVI